MENLYSDQRKNDITENIKIIRENISSACQKSNRNENDIKLMAVTKTVEAQYINHAIDNCGIDLIGENRVQEFFLKKDELHLDKCEAHLIGHLQTNKVKQIVPEVSMIQSVDSIKLAKEIGKVSKNINKTTDILLEINIGNEDSKFGIDKSELSEFVYEVSEIEGIKVKGLMAIPPFSDNLQISQTFFANMYTFFIDISSKKIDNISMDILSMGMSNDYVQAILEGANLIRVGSSMFGKRIY